MGIVYYIDIRNVCMYVVFKCVYILSYKFEGVKKKNDSMSYIKKSYVQVIQ